jgi:hypothetical protein
MIEKNNITCQHQYTKNIPKAEKIYSENNIILNRV